MSAKGTKKSGTAASSRGVGAGGNSKSQKKGKDAKASGKSKSQGKGSSVKGEKAKKKKNKARRRIVSPIEFSSRVPKLWKVVTGKGGKDKKRGNTLGKDTVAVMAEIAFAKEVCTAKDLGIAIKAQRQKQSTKKKAKKDGEEEEKEGKKKTAKADFKSVRVTAKNVFQSNRRTFGRHPEGREFAQKMNEYAQEKIDAYHASLSK